MSKKLWWRISDGENQIWQTENCPSTTLATVLVYARFEFFKNMSISIYYLLIYLLTPWGRVLLEKLTGLKLVTKFPAFYGTRMFITALTSARHLSLSWASSIQSTYPHPTSRRSILILSSHLRLGLPSGLLPSGSFITDWNAGFSNSRTENKIF
jgi:hypothetical protein